MILTLKMLHLLKWKISLLILVNFGQILNILFKVYGINSMGIGNVINITITTHA